jgi:hypothetical protein
MLVNTTDCANPPISQVPTNVRSTLVKHLREVGVTNLFLLLVLAILTVYPLLFVGYTTKDDLMLAIESAKGAFWASAWNFSTSQGRIGLLWAHPLFQLPYLFDSRAWYLATKFGALLLLPVALYYAVAQLFRSQWVALASVVFFLGFAQNGWEHNALTSYPFVFNFLAALFLLSLGIFCTAMDRGSVALSWLSAALYFPVLMTEFFVLYFPFYAATAVSRLPGEYSPQRRFEKTWRLVAPIALALIFYIVIYVGWRLIHPSGYSGNQLDGDLASVAQVVTTFSLSAFPTESLRFLFSSDARLPYTNSVDLRDILQSAGVAPLIRAGVTGLLLYRLLFAIDVRMPRPRTLAAGVALSLVAVFLPNLLLALTAKYQQWVVVSGATSYLYTYHSFIAATILAALILAGIKRSIRASSWRRNAATAAFSLVIVALAGVSFAVELHNQYVAFDQKLSRRKWVIMDQVMVSPGFRSIPDGSTVVAPTLTDFQRGAAATTMAYWSHYVKFRTGKNVTFAQDACAVTAPCYFLIFRQEQHSDQQVVVLTKVTDPALLEGHELTIYSMPTQRTASLLGSFVPGPEIPELAIDGAPVAGIAQYGSIGFFAARLPFNPDARIQTARVSGNVDLVPSGMVVSYFDNLPRLQTWTDELATGIDFTRRISASVWLGASDMERQGYPDLLVEVSGMSGYEPWGRWTDAQTGPDAKFKFRQPLPARFELELKAGAFGPNVGLPIKVRAGGMENSFVVAARKEPGTYRMDFKTNGMTDTLEIVPPNPTSPHDIDPSNRDARKLGVSLYSLRIRDLESSH